MSTPDYISDPGRMVNDAIIGLTRHTAGAVAPRIMKGLAIASEPFFRVNMGQRYLDSGARTTGLVLWLAAAVLSFFFGGLCTQWTANLLRQEWLWNFAAAYGQYVPLGIGLGFGAIFLLLAASDQNTALLRHFDGGTPRHSMSRGEPRIKDKTTQEFVVVLMALFFLAFAMPVGFLFCVSRVFCGLSEAKQQEAIFTRYLDAIDAQIEAEQLESALLGNSPPENTYLYKPLPEKFQGDLRTNIAAAAVGRPVKIVAQGPRRAPTPAPQAMVQPPPPMPQPSVTAVPQPVSIRPAQAARFPLPRTAQSAQPAATTPPASTQNAQPNTALSAISQKLSASVEDLAERVGKNIATLQESLNKQKKG